jgi:mRNA interferase RelE/StbE
LKDISKIPKNNLENIFNKIELLSKKWAEIAQIRKLNNYNLCDYRLRVWNFRILFNIDDIKKEIIIFRILHRSKLY